MVSTNFRFNLSTVTCQYEHHQKFSHSAHDVVVTHKFRAIQQKSFHFIIFFCDHVTTSVATCGTAARFVPFAAAAAATVLLYSL